MKGEVYIYDSAFDGTLTPSAELQIAQLYRPLIESNGLLVTVVPIQQQIQANNCGLFSIAAAYSAVTKDTKMAFTLKGSQLRAHLVKCKNSLDFLGQLSWQSHDHCLRTLQSSYTAFAKDQTRMMKMIMCDDVASGSTTSVLE